MNMLTSLAFVACLLAPPQEAAADLAPKIEAAVQQAGEGKFWGAVLVAKGGDELFFKGYGAADYDKAPITRDSIFELASASKQVTATAILRLVQDKKIKLSDPLRRFFPKCPADKAQVTVRHLLNHTSGIHNERTLPYASEATRAEFAKFFLDAPVVSKPGEQWAYNNGGYALLAAIVEVASRTTFEQYCHAKLFKPAKLKRTGFINEKRMQQGSVTTRRSDRGAEATASDWHYGWGYRGMGGAVSTAADLLQWDRALRGEKVLKTAAKTELYRPSLNNYAGGWMVTTTATGGRKAQHGGDVAGYSHDYIRHLEDDVVIIVLSNNIVSRRVSAAIERLLVKSPELHLAVHWKKLSLDHNQACPLQETAAWNVAKSAGGVAMTLARGKDALAVLTLPAGAATKLAADLESARAQQPSDAAKGVTSGIYLANFRVRGGPDPLVIDKGLRLRVTPNYHGRGGEVDPRVWMLLVEEGGIAHQRWPLMSRFDHAGCDALITALRNASK